MFRSLCSIEFQNHEPVVPSNCNEDQIHEPVAPLHPIEFQHHKPVALLHLRKPTDHRMNHFGPCNNHHYRRHIQVKKVFFYHSRLIKQLYLLYFFQTM
jgi:hypothetical protein